MALLQDLLLFLRVLFCLLKFKSEFMELVCVRLRAWKATNFGFDLIDTNILCFSLILTCLTSVLI